eukprot:343402-Pelagomonas_calceolata.AAC.1
MRYSAAAAQQWQQAADGSRAFYAAAAAAAAASCSASGMDAPAGSGSEGEVHGSASTGARLAHIAAAQLVAMGYECGVWDLLGCVTMAEQVRQGRLGAGLF